VEEPIKIKQMSRRLIIWTVLLYASTDRVHKDIG